MADKKHNIQIGVDEQDYQTALILMDYYYRRTPGFKLGQLFVAELRDLQRRAAADIKQGIVIPGYEPDERSR